MAVATFTIRINGSLVHIDRAAFGRNRVQMVADTVSEQCVTCGQDITETGVRGRGVNRDCVMCGECGTHYPVSDGVLR